MLPYDTITKTFEIAGIGTASIEIATPSTVLSLHMQQSGTQSNTTLYCGTHKLAQNYDKDYGLDLMNYVCNDTLWLNKTAAGDSSFTSISYVRYDRNINNTGGQNIIAGFTYGEIVSTTLLFLILFIGFWSFLAQRIKGVKVQKDYIDYE
jgi:hypothetical protein